jgi:hypothetical protein
MRKFSVIVVAALVMGLLLPMGTQAQDVGGGSIEEIASSVVMIETIRGVRVISGGTGTIISPEGRIYTNEHVIEGGDDFAIYMLDDDLGEQPTLRYYASLEYVSNTLDFAVLQIDRDASGRGIDASLESLPYLSPAHTEDVTIGDRIRIFGYPGIGDGYIIITSGEIVAVQNGTIRGERIPVWYRTDAEISGGNSGGLAVNEAGEFIGLPTWVVTEDRTAGRLGGILPIGAIQQSFGAASPSDGSTQSVDAGMLTVVNNSTAVICSAYISPSTAPSWGQNLLGTNQINGGASFSWEFEIGSYDILLVNCDGDTLEDFRNVTVEDGTIFTYSPGDSTFVSGESATEAAPSVGNDGVLTVVNNSGVTICFVYISPTTASTWGSDQLGAEEVIRAGASREWTLASGTYDVLLQDCERGDLRDTRDVDLTAGDVEIVHN